MDFKHLKVVHKDSNKIVSIFQFTKDATWNGKERDELIAIPADTPKDISEIKMCFTKTFKRYKGTNKEQIVSPFFKRKSGQPKTLSENRIGGESEAHKLAKNEVYEGLYNGELKINGKTINELGAKDLDVSEERYSITGNSIADVFIQFGEYPNNDPLYGIGINIEIQFSSQNENKTKERTLSRLRDGWSVIWLWKDDFDINGKLKINDLKILPREKQLKCLREEEYLDFLTKMNDVGNLIDEKIEFGKEEIQKELKQSKESINELNEKIEFGKEEIQKELKQSNEKIEETIQKQKIKSEELINSFIEEIYLIKDNIKTEPIKEKILNELCENPELVKEFGNVFIQLKTKKLMKNVKNSFPFYLREFFMKHYDEVIKKIYEDNYGDIKKRLDNIKSERDLYEPKKRFLINEPNRKELKKSIQKKLGVKND